VAELARDVDDAGTRATVDAATARLAAELGDQDFALDRWSRVAEATSDRDLTARADLGAALAAYDLGRGAEARRWLDRGRPAFDDAPDWPLAPTPSRHGSCSGSSGGPTTGAPGDARRRARPPGDRLAGR
jgi:hypothetical protein